MTQRDENTVIYTLASGEKYFIGSNVKRENLKVGDIVTDMDDYALNEGYSYCVFRVIELKDDVVIMEKLEGKGYVKTFDGYYRFYGESSWNVLEPEYKEVGSFHFKKQTPDRVCEIINNLYKSGIRARFFYGDSDGQDWLEMHDNIGTIGRSIGGKYNVPLLIARKGNLGGQLLMTDKIVRITVVKEDIWRHPNYHTGIVFNGYNITLGDTVIYEGNMANVEKVMDYLQGKKNRY